MKKLVMIALAAALMSGPVMAQSAAPAAAKPSLMARMKAAHAAKVAAKVAAKPAAAKPAMTAAPAAKPAVAAANNNGQRTAKSLACSKQADAKNIHGSARKSFMSHCKKA